MLVAPKNRRSESLSDSASILPDGIGRISSAGKVRNCRASDRMASGISSDEPQHPGTAICQGPADNVPTKACASSVYLITNTKNGKRYIGQTAMPIEERFKQHASHGNLLFRAMRKHGKHFFTCEVLLKAPQVQCDHYEQAFIKVYNTITPMGYNIERGGRGARKRTADIIARHRAKVIGRKRTGTQLSNIATANKARSGVKNPQSVEGRKRIGQANAKRVWTAGMRADFRERMSNWRGDKRKLQATREKAAATLRRRRCETVQQFHDGLLQTNVVYECEDGVRRKIIGPRFLEVCSHDQAKWACKRCRKMRKAGRPDGVLRSTKVAVGQ